MIRLTEANRDRVGVLLASTNGSRTKGYCYQDVGEIYAAAAEAEGQLEKLGIAKARRIGAEYRAESGPTMPRAYSWNIRINYALFIRGKNDWLLEDLKLWTRTPGEKIRTQLWLTPSQDEEAWGKFRAGRFSVLAPSEGKPTEIGIIKKPEPFRL